MKTHLLHKIHTLLLLFICSLLVFSTITLAQSEAASRRIVDQSKDLDTQQAVVNFYESIEPHLSVNTIKTRMSDTLQYYEVTANYQLNTANGPLSVELVSSVDQNGVIQIQQKQVQFKEAVYEEQTHELLVLYDDELIRLSDIADEKVKQKCIISGVKPLMRQERFQNLGSDAQDQFVLLTKAHTDLAPQRKIIQTDAYECVVVQRSDISDLLEENNVLKICEFDEDYVVEFVDYAKQVFTQESQEKIRELKLKRSHLDVSSLSILNNYLSEDEWDIQPGDSSPYQQFVTPQSEMIQQLAEDRSSDEIYDLAVQWIWVSDSVLHGTIEKWLLPEEFLGATPEYLDNPSPGVAVSDCSEQANTLVSLLRASGVAPEDVRVALGEVNFDGEVGGHAWVEIKHQGRWLVLDPTCGPYYDQDHSQVFSRSGVSYDYWKYHPYPVEGVWVYYNDVYFTDENEEVADGWSFGYDVFTDADMFAGLIQVSSMSTLVVSIVLSVTAMVLLGASLWFHHYKKS